MILGGKYFSKRPWKKIRVDNLSVWAYHSKEWSEFNNFRRLMLVAHRRSIYIINPKFQIKFCFFVASLVFISSLIYPWSIWSVLTSIEQDQKFAAVAASISAQKGDILQLLIVFQLLFVGLVFIICIFQSHKIAGPLYKLKKSLDGIKGGTRPEKIYFRKGDNFTDLADSYNTAVDSMAERQSKDMEYLAEVSKKLQDISLAVPDDKKTMIIEINNKLADIRNRYNN